MDPYKSIKIEMFKESLHSLNICNLRTNHSIEEKKSSHDFIQLDLNSEDLFRF